ncbi:hypothetical protein JFL43_20420 [Viridibacillus sp. YIM B01967]|uniref:YycO n=1 Tax=Viridibacillus soli TaxID=2798301 RepID=A0ABS1HCT8_9BACL|nr:hypothetical protein [Viridibacillus soli]MBK3497151.1 hypothetical protein [Viridibacillus soli]
MKKYLLSSLLAVGLVGSSIPNISFATTDGVPYLNEILQMQPGVSSEELISDISSISENMGITKEEIAKQIYKELKENDLQALKENRIKGGSGGTVSVGNSTRGGSGGTVSVGNSTKGNFFYTDSQTAYLNHGHVGLYYSNNEIVESVPDTGVRIISTQNRKVDQGGALVKSVTTSTDNRDSAADWAYSRVGEDSYSINFATNRTTSHTGAKNCSKLIWSAYMLKANLDLDKDGGLGVYPRDVRDAEDTELVRNI